MIDIMSFPTTNWTLLADATLSGDEEGQRALAEMDLEDLVQDFFLRWLKSQAWKRAERMRGRFRTFLLGAVRHMLAHHHEKLNAEKRGGGTPNLSMEQMAEDGFEIPDTWPPSAPDYDREWALTLLANTLAEIRRNYETQDRLHEFEILSHFLPGGSGEMTIDTAARELAVESATLKTWVQRLRGRFRELLRASVARTVSAPHEVDDELAYLRKLLSRHP
jgi:RNA polymerase sigma-70 factor (ECF subfamily)